MPDIEEQKVEASDLINIDVVRQENVDINPDSLTFGTPSKGGEHKIYGDVLLSPVEFGKKIEIIKLASKLANNEISFEEYKSKVEEYK